jgi:hypothetical protein
MDLQRIDPGIRGFENRVFECGKCYTMKAVPAAIDRMKSPSAGPKVRCSRLRSSMQAEQTVVLDLDAQADEALEAARKLPEARFQSV